MKKFILTLLVLFTSFFLFAQEYDDLYFNSKDRINYKKINPEYIESIALKEYRDEIYDDEILRAIPNYSYWDNHWNINSVYWNNNFNWNWWQYSWHSPFFWGWGWNNWAFSSFYWHNPWHSPFYVWGGWRVPFFHYSWGWWHWHHVPRRINVYNYNTQTFINSKNITQRPIRTNVTVDRVERINERIGSYGNRPSTTNRRYERPYNPPIREKNRAYTSSPSRQSYTPRGYTPSRQSTPSRSYTPSRQSTPSRTYTPSPSRQSAPSYAPSRSYTPSRQSAPSYSRPSTGRRQ